MSRRVAVVLAAGKGTRMKSDLPKVLFRVSGRPMIHYVLDALKAGGVDRVIVVVGFRADLVEQELQGRDGVEFALQEEQLGTGHAVMSCRQALTGHSGPVLVVAGDQPRMQGESINTLFERFEQAPAACILGTAEKPDPTGLGRILRNEAGDFVGIVEEKDATEQQRTIREVNMSYYVFDCPELLSSLECIRADNAQGEYYLTDVPGLLARRGRRVLALKVLKPYESIGINTVDELAVAEQAMSELSEKPAEPQ